MLLVADKNLKAGKMNFAVWTEIYIHLIQKHIQQPVRHVAIPPKSQMKPLKVR